MDSPRTERREVSASAARQALAPRAAHAPGPWRIVERELEDDFYIHDAESAWVCTLPQSRYVDESMRDPQAGANARLIAAAPDLLAALEQVIETTFDVAVNGHLDDSLTITREQAGAIYEAARIVAGKARGQL